MVPVEFPDARPSWQARGLPNSCRGENGGVIYGVRRRESWMWVDPTARKLCSRGFQLLLKDPKTPWRVFRDIARSEGR